MQERSPVHYTVIRTFVLATALSAACAVAALAAESPDAAAEQAFQAAHAHFLKGRELQRLHRNTPASTAEFTAAAQGYRAVATQYPQSTVAPRALYMAGSAELFLDKPSEAIAAYSDVIERYPSDRGYLAKALVRKASVQKNSLDPAAARRTLELHTATFDGASPQKDDADRLARSLAAIGKPAPPLRATRWFGAAPADNPFAGQVTVVYFWATWCPNCRKEVDFLNDLRQRYTPRGVRFIGITDNSRGQTDDTVAAYLKEHRFDFPNAIDAQGATTRAYGGGSVPTAVVVGRDGTVRWHDHPAALDDAVLDRLLKESGGGA